MFVTETASESDGNVINSRIGRPLQKEAVIKYGRAAGTAMKNAVPFMTIQIGNTSHRIRAISKGHVNVTGMRKLGNRTRAKVAFVNGVDTVLNVVDSVGERATAHPNSVERVIKAFKKRP